MKNILKKFSLVLLIIIPLISIGGCNKKSTNYKNNTKDDTVVIGYDNTFVPMGFLDENNEIVGFDIDLVKEVFSRLNMNVKFQNIDWSMKDTELNSGNVDALWNGYTLTEERRKKVDYSNPYLINKQVIVTLNNSSIKNKSDLKGKLLGTQQGSAGLDAIEKDTNLVDNLQDKTPILYDSFDNAFRDLEFGRVDAVVADEVLAKYYISNSNKQNFVILKDNFWEESFVVGFKKGNTSLRNKINKALAEVKEDKTFDKIYKKWFN